MTQQTFLRLEPIQGQPNQYVLSWQGIRYPTVVRFENDLVFTDLLRALPNLLLGQRPSWLQVQGDPLKILGERLWKILLPESAPVNAHQALARALRTEMTPLLLSVPETLTRLPWELLSDPEQQAEASFLARQRPLMRLIDTPTASSPALPFPLKVLVLISSPPALGGNSRVDVESERAAIVQATREAREAGHLHLLIEDIVTPQRVQRALMRFHPHLVHYIGHGGYEPGTGGVLLLENEQGEVLHYPAHRLAELLRPRHIQAVLLHACETASGHGMLDLPNLAEVLLNASLPAVLAQQANLTYESSVRASETWYTALTSGQSLAEALFEVRQHLAHADRPDWAAPVLSGNLASIEPLCNSDAPAGTADSELIMQGAASDLPAPIGVFVGRHREMRALHLMLEHAPGEGPVLALITGPGGMGKSTLAAQAVTRYGKQYKATLTLRCAEYRGIDLWLQRIGEFLQQLNAPGFLLQILPKSEISLSAKVEAAIASLNQVGPVLVIVDNLESVQEDDQTLYNPDLRRWFQQCLTGLRGSRLLLTGRYALVGLLPEKRFAASVLHIDLDDLSSYEVQRLLMRHPSLRSLEETTQKMLSETFGRLPYVYDVLSTKAAGQSLDALVHDIQDRITEERERRTAEEWQEVHQEVSEFAALATIASRLSEGSRKTLAGVCLLQKSFPLEALEQGLQATRDDWQPLLDWSLIRHDPFARTYQVHSVTRYHARKLVREEERLVWMDQLARWYEGYADRESHDLGDYLEAHRLWEEAGKTQQAGKLALQLVLALRRFGLYQMLHNLCVTTLQGALRSEDKVLESSALYQLGILAQDQGEYAEARRLYEQSREIAERLGDQSGVAASLHQLGTLAQAQGEYVEARRLYEQSRKIAEQLGDHGGVSLSLHELGKLAQAQGEHAEARRLYERSRVIMERLGEQSGVAASLHQLGILAQDQGEYAEARRLYEQSRVIKERLGDQSGVAASLHELGALAQAQGEYAEARRLYERSRVIMERLGDQSGMASSLGQLGLLAYAQHDFAQALQATVQALRIFLALRSPYARLAEQTIANIRAAMGEDAFQAQWQVLSGGLPFPSQNGDSAKIQTIIAFLQTPTWEESQHFLVTHPDLLRPEMERVFQEFLTLQQDERVRRSILEHLHLLARCRDIGIDEAYQERAQNTEPGEAPDEEGVSLEQLVTMVISVIQAGDKPQQQQLAQVIQVLRGQLPAEGQSLSHFLGCLIAQLHGEVAASELLVPPFTEMWQQLQIILQEHADVSAQVEEGKSNG